MFEWDSRKAKSNRLKHVVSFEEAATAFLDPAGLDGKDLEHSKSEARRLRLAKGRRQSLGYSVYDKETRQ